MLLREVAKIIFREEQDERLSLEAPITLIYKMMTIRFMGEVILIRFQAAPEMIHSGQMMELTVMRFP